MSSEPVDAPLDELELVDFAGAKARQLDTNRAIEASADEELDDRLQWSDAGAESGAHGTTRNGGIAREVIFQLDECRPWRQSPHSIEHVVPDTDEIDVVEGHGKVGTVGSLDHLEEFGCPQIAVVLDGEGELVRSSTVCSTLDRCNETGDEVRGWLGPSRGGRAERDPHQPVAMASGGFDPVREIALSLPRATSIEPVMGASRPRVAPAEASPQSRVRVEGDGRPRKVARLQEEIVHAQPEGVIDDRLGIQGPGTCQARLFAGSHLTVEPVVRVAVDANPHPRVSVVDTSSSPLVTDSPWGGDGISSSLGDMLFYRSKRYQYRSRRRTLASDRERQRCACEMVRPLAEGGVIIQVEGLSGRVAVVTGAGRGIGKRIAEVLGGNGALVAGLDLTAPDIPGILGLACDVSDEAAVDASFGEVERRLGTPTVLVLNAGIFPVVPFEETSLATWNRTLAVNLTGAFLCARRALPGMREAGYGRIVGIGSSAGKAGGARSVAAYAASKAGLMTLMKSIANEYARYGITANALAPALIDTDMAANIRDLVDRVPVGRLGTVDEVASLVAFI